MKSFKKFNSEKQLTNYIVKMLRQDDTGDILAYKRHGGGINEAGKPDVTGVVAGIRIELEMKDPARMSKEMASHLENLEICLASDGNAKSLFAANLEVSANLLPLASKIQQVWIKRFLKAGAIASVICSPAQVVILCELARHIGSKRKDLWAA